MRNPRAVASGILAAVVATCPVVAAAQPAPRLESMHFDRCTTSTGAVRLLARQTRHQGSEGFDARGCRPGTSADALEESSTSGRHGLALRGDAEVGIHTEESTIFTPSLSFSVKGLPRDFQATASYAVDVITAASADVVTSASSIGGTERHLATLAADAGIGPARLGLDGGLSVEDDLLGTTAGASVSIDLGDEITPMLGYHFGFDIMGRPEASFDVYRTDVVTHTFDAGASIRVGPATALVFVGTVSVVRGDTSTPDQYVPLFSPEAAELLARGATAEELLPFRLPGGVLERLGESRERFAVLERVVHRFAAATLRLDERLYIDTWGLKSSTTDVRSWHEVAGPLRMGPHARVHVQGGVDFWRRVYVAARDGQELVPPPSRTVDPELGPLLAATVGGGAQWSISEMFALRLLAEGSYTHFRDALFLTDRWGFFSAATLELGVE